MAQLLARPTVYNGIQMRSRLEAHWAAEFDRLGFAWEYEPRCYANEAGQYLPDFYVIDNEDRDWIVETKGVFTDDVAAVRRRMEIVWASEPHVGLLLIEGQPGEGTYDPVSDSWYGRTRSWQRGWMSLWNHHDGRRARMWEIYPGGDPYETIDYELRIEGSDW